MPTEPAPLRLTHIITDLDVGGAEMGLYRLLGALDPRQVQAEVISLRAAGPVAEKIAALGVPVRSLGMNPLAPRPAGWRN